MQDPALFKSVILCFHVHAITLILFANCPSEYFILRLKTRYEIISQVYLRLLFSEANWLEGFTFIFKILIIVKAARSWYLLPLEAIAPGLWGP